MKKKIIGISIVCILFVCAIFLIATGKINLNNIMGNTAQGRYTCPSGYSLYGSNKCRKVTGYTYTCPSGYSLYSSNKCRKGNSIINARSTPKYTIINATRR